jgi:hypothetical protein
MVHVVAYFDCPHSLYSSISSRDNLTA